MVDSKENCIMTDQYNRIQGAVLKTQQRNYSVYKGVNTVGRNKSAIINLKNLNVSQNHAVIIIVDDTQHFISDLNSSNGTYLHNTKLSSYKLYELTNDVEIKFGDFIASYSRVSNTDTTIHLEKESIDMSQNMTQNFYRTDTQLMINESALNHTNSYTTPHRNAYLEDIHDVETQVVVRPSTSTDINTNCSDTISDNDIHLAPTQVADYQLATVFVKPPSNSLENDKLAQQETDIHEMPTQVVFPREFDKQADQQETNIHEMATQVVDLPQNLTVQKCQEVNIREKTDTDTETDELFEKTQNSSNVIEETVIEETVIDESHADKNMHEESNDSIDFLMCNKEATSTNDIDHFSDSEGIGQPKKRPARKLSSSEELTQPHNVKPTYNSDSDTDIENEIDMPSLPAKKVTDSDSDTEIEDNFPEQSKMKSKVLNSDSETDIDEPISCNEDLTQSQNIIKPKILNKKRILDSDSETDVEDNNEKEKQVRVETNTDKDVLNDTDCIPATQDAFADVFAYKDTKISTSNANSQNASSEESFRLGLTELMVESVENKMDVHEDDKTSNATNEENKNNAKIDEDNDQQLKINEETTPSENDGGTVSEVVENKLDDDLFMMPTQKICTDDLKDENQETCKEKPNADESKTSAVSDTKATTSKDDFYIIPTQKLNETEIDNEQPHPAFTSEPEFKTPPQKKYNFRKKEVNLDRSLSKIFNKNQDDPYSAPTQKLDDEEDIYLLPTQKINEEQKQLDLYLQPTQDLNKDEDLYIAPTQQININAEKNNTSPMSDSLLQKNRHITLGEAALKKIEKSNEELYMAATQPINASLTIETDKTSQTKSVTDLYLQETQDLGFTINEESSTTHQKNKNLEKNGNEKIHTTNVIAAPALQTAEKRDEDLYSTMKQPINPNFANKKLNKPVTDLFLQETEDMGLNKDLEADKNESDEDPYMVPTQQINQDFDTRSIKVPQMRQLKSDLNSPKMKRKRDVVAEESIQIDTSIKKSLTTFKKPSPSMQTSKEQTEKITTDQSETLSQIQRFVAETSSYSKKATLPKKRTSAQAQIEVQSETLSQIEAFIKTPLSTIKENIAIPCKKQKSDKVEQVDEVFQKRETSLRSKRTKSANQSTVQEFKEDGGNLNKSEANLSSSSDKSDRETTKIEVEKSFELLEAKSSKTRKSQRLINSTEVKVALHENRRSMTTSVVPERSSSNEFVSVTRRTRKKSTNINNNNVVTISDKSETKTSGRSKRKLEPIKEKSVPEPSHSGKPEKMLKMDISVKESDSSSPSTSNLSNDSVLSTPSRVKNVQSSGSFSTPEKGKRKQKPKVVFTMLDSPLLETLIRQLGGSVVDSVESCTVLVTEQVKRSQKLLTAVGQGKPICSPDWIRASKKANEFLDPWDYILSDKEAESKWNFSLKDSLTCASNKKLLSDYTFQVMVNNAEDVLKGAIKACGGKCVPRCPAKNVNRFFVVIASPENKSKYLKIRKQHPQVTVVKPEAIFDGVLRQELQLDVHTLV